MSTEMRREAGPHKDIREPKPRTLVKIAEKITFQEALRRADEQSMVLALNRRLTELIVNGKVEEVGERLDYWGGIIAAYSKKLEGQVVGPAGMGGRRYVFPVPDRHQGERNALILAKCPDFELAEDGPNDLVVNASNVILLGGVPKVGGYYLGDGEHHFPIGERLPLIPESMRIGDMLPLLPEDMEGEDSEKKRELAPIDCDRNRIPRHFEGTGEKDVVGALSVKSIVNIYHRNMPGNRIVSDPSETAIAIMESP